MKGGGKMESTIELIMKEVVKRPKRSTNGSAGYDIFAHRKLVFPAGKEVNVRLPFYFQENGDTFEVELNVRSSFGIKKGLRISSKGETNILKVRLNLKETVHIVSFKNESKQDIIVEKGQHFAQFLILKRQTAMEKVDIKPIKECEEKKYKTIASSIEKDNNRYHYQLDETIELNPYEQRLLPTGLKAYINKGTWLSITPHEEVKEKIMLANQRGIGDYDYAMAKNDGHYFIAIVNRTNQTLKLKKETKLTTWYSEPFYTIRGEEKPSKNRLGGIGSTT